jgi:hypothetical protein
MLLHVRLSQIERKRPVASDWGEDSGARFFRVRRPIQAGLLLSFSLLVSGNSQNLIQIHADPDGRVPALVLSPDLLLHFKPETQSLGPAGNGATSGSEEGKSALRKSTMATATPFVAIILPQP